MMNFRQRTLFYLAVLAGVVFLPATVSASEKNDSSQYILTPKASPSPRINGAKVYGARPGADFLYRIPCTGERPILFSAERPAPMQLLVQVGAEIRQYTI